MTQRRYGTNGMTHTHQHTTLCCCSKQWYDTTQAIIIYLIYAHNGIYIYIYIYIRNSHILISGHFVVCSKQWFDMAQTLMPRPRFKLPSVRCTMPMWGLIGTWFGTKHRENKIYIYMYIYNTLYTYTYYAHNIYIYIYNFFM